MEILLTLIAITAGLTISSFAEDIAEQVARSKDMSTNDIMANINKILNEARKMSSEEVEKFNDRLASMQMPITSSPTIKDFFIKQKQKLATETRSKTRKLADVERSLNDIESRSNTLANQSSNVRSGSNASQDYKGIEDEAIAAKQKIDDIIKGVDQNV